MGTLVHVAQIVFRLDRPIPVCRECAGIGRGAEMGDWAYGKLRPLPEETRRKMIRNEFGGINESFYNLYALTGDERYRWLAGFFYHNDVIDPLKEQRDDLGTKHTNTFIPKYWLRRVTMS